jgi:hypothetical protein
MRLRAVTVVILVLSAASLAGCTVPHRGELGVSVDTQGRLIGVIALCSDQHLDYVNLTDMTQRGVQVTLHPASDDRPESIVLSDPGDGWTDDWPERPTYGEDPRKLTANHAYVLDGRAKGEGLFGGDSILFSVEFVPEQVRVISQFRPGTVLTWDGQIVSTDEFHGRDHC